MEKSFIGVDISKEVLDIAICDDQTMEISQSWQVKNSLEGIDVLLKAVKKLQSNRCVWVCFEHTGNYGLLLAHCLETAGISYSAVAALQIKRSIGMTRGKNDQVDAQRIAVYAASNQHKLNPTHLPGAHLLKTRQILTYRNQLLKISVQLQNSLKSFKINQQVIDLKDIIDDIEQRIKELAKSIKAQDEKVKRLLLNDDSLKKNFEKVCQVKGVGPLIAAHMILITNNFKSITDARKFNCYAGIAPFEYRSGSSINKPTRTSKLRNKTIKTLLFNGANTAVLYDGQLKKYYQRKRAEGKAHLSVINAVACKLVYRIYAVIKRETPYVNFAL